ncbi:T9SS-dependent choice-of-anchor J family protein [Chryseobacterium gambrini]|uniref:T9SS-dependent choice-of-anchor J family protein n=1 Tax=Chryseobacterium gambrini TaxID=373672 RepID=UPI0022F3F8E2|nr:choice-of-anchor J domain-containing protein [Chryseobacterium gambrini]WBX97460.1 choice-of-anchor J domain-containing protein [Chryseobacterium gambrini]
MKKILLLGSILSLVSMNAQTNVYSYGFDTAFTNWTTSNQSSPVTTSVWTKATYTTPLTNPLFGSGNTTTVPVGQAGGNNSFALVNYTSTSGAGTISNWLFTNAIDVKDGDIVSFYSRKGTDGTIDYPDRLELRYALAAGAVLPTTGASAVGSFTNLGVSVNPNLASGFVYPKTWTKYSFTVTGVGANPVPVRFAFRYYVTDGGPSGSNSDLIGIDTFSIDRPTLSTNDVALNEKSISVYPNPTTDYISIKSADKFSNIEVFDIAGKKVEVKVEGDKINVKHLNSGSYIISMESKGNKISQKFIKK